jgi:hypothetical protein
MTKKPAYVLPGLLDGMPYTPSHKTDIRKTFERARAQLAESKARQDKVLQVIRAPK